VPYESRTYLCNDTYLFGGYEWSFTKSQKYKFFERQYLDLPPHTTIYFTLNFWVMDTWDHSVFNISNQDGLEIQFDSLSPIFLFGVRRSDFGNLPSLCGQWNVSDVRDILIFGSVAHSNSSLNFKIISKLNSRTQDESF